MTATDMSVFWKTLGLIAAAEMGDKTQLLTLALATRFPAWTVLGGVLLGTMANHALAVAVGGAALLIIPVAWVKLLAGLSFIGFGLWTARGDEAPGAQTRALGHPVITVAVAFFIAEMADKTQLATAVLAAEAGALLVVWLGSSMGMVAADGLAIVVGSVLGRRLPDRLIKAAATVLFVLFGVLLIREGVLAWR